MQERELAPGEHGGVVEVDDPSRRARRAVDHATVELGVSLDRSRPGEPLGMRPHRGGTRQRPPAVPGRREPLGERIGVAGRHHQIVVESPEGLGQASDIRGDHRRPACERLQHHQPESLERPRGDDADVGCPVVRGQDVVVEPAENPNRVG